MKKLWMLALKKKTKWLAHNCKESFYHHHRLIEHLKQNHNEDIQFSQLNFSSEKDHFSWKEAKESNKYVYYSEQTSTKESKTASYTYYLSQNNGSSILPTRKGNVSRKTNRRSKKGVIKNMCFAYQEWYTILTKMVQQCYLYPHW